jgi:Fe2+ transport system protein B
MNLSILDLVLFQSNPEKMQCDSPEKYQYIKKFLSQRENRSPFFRTIEDFERDNDMIPKEESSNEKEFSKFWERFQKECLNINHSQKKSVFENLKEILILLRYPMIPVFSFLISLFMVFTFTFFESSNFTYPSDLSISFDAVGTQNNFSIYALFASVHILFSTLGFFKILYTKVLEKKNFWISAMSIFLLIGVYFSLEWGKDSELIVSNLFILFDLIFLFKLIAISFLSNRNTRNFKI